MKKAITILTLLIAASTMSAQPTNPLTPKSRTHERETLSTHERTLPNGKTMKTTKPDARKAATGKDIKNATLKMDSVTYSGGNKEIFEYDDMGRLATFFYWEYFDGTLQWAVKIAYTYNTQNERIQIEYDWNLETNEWIIYGKREYTYDGNGNPILDISFDWDSDISQWRNSSKAECTYNAQGNLTLRVTYWGYDFNQWENGYKAEFTYDAQGNQTLEIEYMWNSSLNYWRNAQKIEQTYNAQGNQTLYAYYSWDNDLNQWRNYSKSEYTYDTQGNRILQVSYSWNDELNLLRIESKSEYTYDVQGNRILQISYSWDDDLAQWRNGGKSESTYDAQGNNTLYIAYLWDTYLNQWINYYKKEYEYDAQGNQTLEVDSNWDTHLNQWIGSSKREYAYNLSYTWADVFVPEDWFERDSENILLSRIHYDWDRTLSDWGEPRIATYHYSEITTSIPTHPQHNISIYPNPTSGELRMENGELRMANVEVFDIMGRKQHAEIRESNGGVLLNIAHLPSGIYLVKAGEQVWKVVKN